MYFSYYMHDEIYNKVKSNHCLLFNVYWASMFSRNIRWLKYLATRPHHCWCGLLFWVAGLQTLIIIIIIKRWLPGNNQCHENAISNEYFSNFVWINCRSFPNWLFSEPILMSDVVVRTSFSSCDHLWFHHVITCD